MTNNHTQISPSRLMGWLGSGLLLLLAVVVASVWQPDRPVEALTAKWAPAPSQWIRVELPALEGAAATGIRLHMRDEGPRDDAEPIVLVHGTGASLHTWDGWVAQLKGTRRVVRLDLPGYGLTGPFDDHIYSMARYSAVLAALADALKLPAAVYGGNSLGGYVVWEHAVRQPMRVSRLLLVDSAGYPLPLRDVPIGFRIAQTPGLNKLMQHVLPRGVIESSVKNVYGDPSRVTPELVDRYFELTTRAGNRAAVVASFAQRKVDTQNGEAAKRVAQIKQPTFILWGGQDRLIPPEHAQQFRRDIASAQVAVLPSLGHVPMEEDPVASLAAVRAWLGR